MTLRQNTEQADGIGPYGKFLLDLVSIEAVGDMRGAPLIARLENLAGGKGAGANGTPAMVTM